MGKNIKSYATIPKVQFPQEREGYLTAKSPNLLAKIWYSLTVHIHFFILNLQAKFFKFTFCLLAKFPANYTNSAQFAPQKKPQIMQNSHRLSTIHYTFRCLTSGRELSEIPANQAKFAPFTHKFHELRKFRTKIHPHLVHYFQNHQQRTPRNWSESTRFCSVRPQLPRIMQNSLNPHPWLAI